MSLISLIFGTLSLVLIFKTISILYHYYVNWRRYKDIPGPSSLPILGNSLELMKMTNPERALWFISLIHRFRDGIFVVWLGIKPTIVIYKPEYLETILHSTVNIEKGMSYDVIRPWLGNGLLTSTGAQWFHDRKLIGPTFHFSILEQFAVILSDKTEILIKCLQKEIEKNPEEAIDFFPFAINVTLDIICETAMGVNVRAQEVGNEYCSTVQRTSTLTFERILQPWYWFDWTFYSMPKGREYRKKLNQLHSFTKWVISKKKSERRSQNGFTGSVDEKHQNDIGTRKRKVFLDLLLDQNEIDDAPLSDDELRAQVDTFMFEGHDTTAAAITFTLFCLGYNLEHQDKVHEELDEVFKDSQAPANLKELSQLKYLDRVIKESLRLYPSVPVISRRLAKDVKLGDYNISKDTMVTLAIALVHINYQVWPDPYKFDPDRFLPENSKHRNPYAYIPFSAGPRNCIGQKFALLEEKIILTAILRKWRVRSLETLYTMEYSASMILRPKEKVPVHFMPKR